MYGIMQKTKAYVVGLSIGTFWLFAVSSGFAIFTTVRATDARMPLIVASVIGGTFLAITFLYIMAALKLPSQPGKRDWRISRQFALIVFLEFAAISLASVVCFATRHLHWLDSITVTIVGIHFIPLAKLFGVPRYTVLGLLFCAVTLLTLMLVPEHARIGVVPTREVYLTFGCVVSTWVIAIGSLLELRDLTAQVRRNPKT